ncbi:MAG: hypothetical protein ACYDCK_09275 [Thermoplasmatota archaeon]
MPLLTSLIVGVLALGPAAATLFLSYARYDGHFKDQTIFLFFLGGFALGMLLAILDLLLLSTTEGIVALIVFGIGAAVAHSAAATAALNRKKWQGERHALFNGGALGCGISSVAMLGFATKTLGDPIVPGAAIALLLMSIGYAGTHFALGVLIGNGVAARTPFWSLTLGALGVVPLTLLLLEYWHTPPPLAGFGTPQIFWGAWAALYGVGGFVLAATRWLPNGVTPEARSQMRRFLRTSAR